jgi:uncharacterized protein (TIGR02246 family)
MPASKLLVSRAMLLVLSLAIACSGGSKTSDGDAVTASAPDSNAVRRAVDSAHARLDSALLRHDMAAAVDVLSDDYVSMEQAGQHVRGRDLIRAKLDNMAKQGRLTAVDYPAEGFDISGDLAVKYGRYRLTFVPTGKSPVTDSGSFMHVWRRQGDGAWRLAREIVNPVPSSVSTPAAGEKR